MPLLDTTNIRIFTSTHDISRIIEILGCNIFQRDSEWAWNLQNDNLDFIKNHVMSKEEYEYGKKIFKSFITVIAFFPGIFSIFYGDEVGMKGIGNLANRGAFPWDDIDSELLSFFIKIIRVKKQNTFLKKADIKIIEISKYLFVYERFTNEERIRVIASRTHHETEISIPYGYEVIFGSNEIKKVLEPYGQIVLKCI